MLLIEIILEAEKATNTQLQNKNHKVLWKIGKQNMFCNYS